MRQAILALALLVPTAAGAQTPAETVAKLNREYGECFYASTAAQIQAIPGNKPDLNMMAEYAFQACISEESAMRLVMLTNRMEPRSADAALLANRLRLKRELIEIGKDPARFLGIPNPAKK